MRSVHQLPKSVLCCICIWVRPGHCLKFDIYIGTLNFRCTIYTRGQTYRDFSWKFNPNSMSFGLSFACKTNKHEAKLNTSLNTQELGEWLFNVRYLPNVLRNLKGLCIFDSLSLIKCTLSTSIVPVVLTVGPILSIQKLRYQLNF